MMRSGDALDMLYSSLVASHRIALPNIAVVGAVGSSRYPSCVDEFL
jgi:hypothetical protein